MADNNYSNNNELNILGGNSLKRNHPSYTTRTNPAGEERRVPVSTRPKRYGEPMNPAPRRDSSAKPSQATRRPVQTAPTQAPKRPVQATPTGAPKRTANATPTGAPSASAIP